MSTIITIEETVVDITVDNNVTEVFPGTIGDVSIVIDSTQGIHVHQDKQHLLHLDHHTKGIVPRTILHQFDTQ